MLPLSPLKTAQEHPLEQRRGRRSLVGAATIIDGKTQDHGGDIGAWRLRMVMVDASLFHSQGFLVMLFWIKNGHFPALRQNSQPLCKKQKQGCCRKVKESEGAEEGDDKLSTSIPPSGDPHATTLILRQHQWFTLSTLATMKRNRRR